MFKLYKVVYIVKRSLNPKKVKQTLIQEMTGKLVYAIYHLTVKRTKH